MTAARRILVVDDDPASCDLVAYFLKSLGYRVAIAPDGNRALNVGSEGDIELVILDEHLPIYDGIEVLAMLRKRHVMRPLKVLAITGDDSEDVRSAFESHGIDGFLTKPIDLEGLREAVSRLMADHVEREDGLYRRLHERWLGR